MEIVAYNGTTLAFIGDAVMTLWAREKLVREGYQRPNDLQNMTSHYVSAKAQATYLTALIEKGYFDEEEMEIIKRGRNAQTKTIAKNADMMTYRLATGFEAIVGYYYLSGQCGKLEKLWNEVVMLGAR